MKIAAKIDWSKAQRLIAKVSGPQAREAVASALNDAAFKARSTVQANMKSSFDRVTPYIVRSVQVDKATPERLEAVVSAKYMGGKGIDPQNVLAHEILGGGRKDKASERKLTTAGILPPGYAVVPGRKAELDRYGNIKGSFMVMLLSYFGAFPEGQGYRANMTERKKKKKRGQLRNERGYLTTTGVRYFVAYGRLRSGPTRHLHPGIWQASGTHDVKVEPILMFVRKATYRTKLDFYDTPAKDAVDKFNPRLRYHLRRVIEGQR